MTTGATNFSKIDLKSGYHQNKDSPRRWTEDNLQDKRWIDESLVMPFWSFKCTQYVHEWWHRCLDHLWESSWFVLWWHTLSIARLRTSTPNIWHKFVRSLGESHYTYLKNVIYSDRSIFLEFVVSSEESLQTLKNYKSFEMGLSPKTLECEKFSRAHNFLPLVYTEV